MAAPELSLSPRATLEQRQAILTQDRALVVQAGAGTGKTWVLVQRFLALLENHPDWSLDSIVAVTFTEKAAREMRGRIRRAIEARAADRPDQPIWQSRRRELDQLIVGTIHGLCARILRENAIAAAIDPRFSVLDEEEATLLKEEAIESTLATLAEADSPALELLSSLMVTDLRREMESLLNRRGIVKQLFDTLPDQESLLARWRLGLAEMKAALQSRLTTDEPFQHALQDLPAIPLPADTSDSLYPHVVAAQEGCRLWRAGDGPAALPHWLSLNLRGGKQANWGGKEALAELKAGLTALRGAAQTLEKAGFALQVGPDDEEAAALLQRWQLLWTALETTYAGLKEARQALDFDDLELEAVKLLEQEPRNPRLAAFMSRVQHLMVDEFQDTNPLQKRIVYALAHPSEPGRLFVVG
ncbi:MAG: UvrD-helicase domain-containing protein, partial [Anaerolineales bacterium]|nr:UvrD-helicase domain-containing protein [Anaerolineales bacterium]